MSSPAAALAAALNAAIGKNAEEQEVKNFIDTGYQPLNEVISGRRDGGIPQGRITEIFGGSSTGKTALATQLMIAAQRQGGVAIFQDVERSLDAGMAEENGLDLTPGLWVYKLPLTWEEANSSMVKAAKTIRDAKLIAPEAPIICVIDSLAACIPESVLYDAKTKKLKELDALTMNDNTALARVTSATLKLIKPMCREFNLTAVYLNQIRTKPGVVYGDPTTTPGGSAMEFYADVRLATGRKMIREGADKVLVGQNCGIVVKKSKLTAPFKECDLRMTFRDDGMTSFDFITTLVELLVEQKKLSAAGYIEWEGKKLYKRGLIEHLSKDAAAMTKLYALLYGAAPVALAA